MKLWQDKLDLKGTKEMCYVLLISCKALKNISSQVYFLTEKIEREIEMFYLTTHSTHFIYG